MATAQMHRPAVSSVALPNRVATEQQSLVLVKRLLAVSVSCITYLRGLFPEYAYGTRYLEDICVKILREDKSCPGSTQLVKCNKSSSSSVCLDVKKASILLIRKLYVLMQNLGPLPNDVCLTMKLFYYDEVTPTNYQPPGFKEGSCDGMMFEGEPMHLNVGEVATPYHVLKVKVTTEKDRMENIGKSILNDGETKPVTRAINLDKEEVEKTDHPMTDEMAQDNNKKVEKNDTESLNVEGLHLTCEEDDSMFDDSQNQGNSASQTDNKLSYSRRTRSGRIFHNPEKGLDTKKIQDLEGNMERSQPEKRSQPFEIQNSQDEPAAPKRRKFSEPKERF